MKLLEEAKEQFCSSLMTRMQSSFQKLTNGSAHLELDALRSECNIATA